MQTTRVENLPPPPGVINSLKAGFEAIASHITAILLPLILDLFFWLGPRLRMDALFASIKGDLVKVWSTSGAPAADIQQAVDLYQKTIPSINLFWLLRTLPIGISSLIFPQGTSQTPLGAPSILEVNAVSLLGWMFMLTLIGWIGGGVYFRSVAWFSTATQNTQPISTFRAIAQTTMLSIVWVILVIVIGIPVLLVLTLLLNLSAFLANIAVLVLSLASMWLIVPLFFWPHGVFIKRQNFLMSMLSSLQMARFTLPTSSMFVLTIFLLSVGLNYLWSIPPQDSWVTLFGIFGHAFVATALLSSSFIYYRDMNVWLQDVIERLKSIPPRQALTK